MKRFFRKLMFYLVALCICFSLTTTPFTYIPIEFKFEPKEEPLLFAKGEDIIKQPESPSVKDLPSNDVNEYTVPITMYYQGDERWANFLYGGYDRMSSHGCGPTALAILVSSLSDTVLLPTEAAEFAANNGYYARGNGTVHALIPDGAEHYGLYVEFLPTITAETCRNVLAQDKLMVLLVGPGDFTRGGHFIIIHGYKDDGTVMVADPASSENSSKTWNVDDLVSQLATWATDSGPVWIIS